MPPFEPQDRVVIKEEFQHLFSEYLERAKLPPDARLTVHSIRAHPANPGTWKIAIREFRPPTEFMSTCFKVG
jgi:hypothetical protein